MFWIVSDVMKNIAEMAGLEFCKMSKEKVDYKVAYKLMCTAISKLRYEFDEMMVDRNKFKTAFEIAQFNLDGCTEGRLKLKDENERLISLIDKRKRQDVELWGHDLVAYWKMLYYESKVKLNGCRSINEKHDREGAEKITLERKEELLTEERALFAIRDTMENYKLV